MPHDARGRRLEVGDAVLLPATVIRVDQGEDYCNVTIRSTRRLLPGTSQTEVTLNAGQVVTGREDDVPVAKGST